MPDNHEAHLAELALPAAVHIVNIATLLAQQGDSGRYCALKEAGAAASPLLKLGN